LLNVVHYRDGNKGKFKAICLYGKYKLELLKAAVFNPKKQQ